MNSILENVLNTGLIRDIAGKDIALHSNTSREQCMFLAQLVEQIDARQCLEIGLAYGLSSLAVCGAISGKENAGLVSIDPFQKAHWNDLGLLNLQRAGFQELVDFHGGFSQEVLPALLAAGRKFDFAYVDTTKIFDMVLVDACFIVRMLNVGGVVVFDDCSWPGIKKLVRYLSSWPHLRVLDVHGPTSAGVLRRWGSYITRLVPSRGRIFRSELLQSDEALGVSGGCVAFQKLEEDSRPWDWSLVP